jgi:MtN3 and saliva related transmembrane protein
VHWIEILGLAAGALVTGAYIPGVIAIWKLRPEPAVAISLPMYIALSIGVLGWLIYGIEIGSLSVIIANAVGLPLTASILTYKILYG